MSHRIVTLFIIFSFQMPAFAVQDFAVTREELAVMPPYCTAFYGHFFGLPKLQDSPLRNTIPAGCPSLHHYCDALKSMIRADRNISESGYWLGLAVQTFESMAQSSFWASCPLRPEAFLNLGWAQLRQSRRGGSSSSEAAANFMKALELKPDYLAAYYALSDYYVDSGDKKKALSVVEDGLRDVPDSQGLLRRFKELGGKVPPAPIVVTTKPVVPEAAKDAPIEQRQTPVEKTISPPSAVPDPTTRNKETEEPTSPKIGSPTNPWCRFCPPE